MRPLKIVQLLLGVCLALCYPTGLQAQTAPHLLYAGQMAGKVGTGGTSIAVDPNGNIYTAGYFTGSVDFDLGPGVYELTSNSPYGKDIFVAKYNVNRELLWAKSMGSERGDDYANALAIDKSGNVYIAGSFQDTVDFDPGPGTFIRVGAYCVLSECSSSFVLKLNTDGNFAWAAAFNRGSSYAISLALDKNANVYTTGGFANTNDFDPGEDTAALTSWGNSDIYLSKLDSNGQFVWVQQVGGADPERAGAVATDTAGNVYLAGGFRGQAFWGTGFNITNHTAEGNPDIFVSKLNSEGVFLWTRQTKSPDGRINTMGIHVDEQGNIWHTGRFSGDIHFDPDAAGPSLSSANTIGYDGYITKMNPEGATLWAGQIATDYDCWNSAVASDPDGNIYITGYYSGNVDFDPGPNIYHIYGSRSGFVLKLTNAHLFDWVAPLTQGASVGSGLFVDAGQHIWSTGYFSTKADFDPSADSMLLTCYLNAAYIWELGQHPVSITDPSGAANIKAYPNPTTAQITVQQTGQPFQQAGYTLSNMLGQAVLQANDINGNQFFINMQPLPTGTYLLDVKEAGKLLYRSKVVKQ